jgi:alkylated DNA repair dioxygenase AlkB
MHFGQNPMMEEEKVLETTKNVDVPYSYFPSFIQNVSFESLLDEVGGKCHRYPIVAYDKVFTSRRRSCVVSDSEDHHSYSSLQNVLWKDCPLIQQLRETVEEKCGLSFDYVLIHIYEDGSDYIGYHNDREALTTTIASLSFGEPRKFRLRKIKDTDGKWKTKGWDAEYWLQDGDLLVMNGDRTCVLEDGRVVKYPSCQKQYKHTIIQSKKITRPRINLTFRQKK